jgi:Rod binding domain-containing protein
MSMVTLPLPPPGQVGARRAPGEGTTPRATPTSTPTSTPTDPATDAATAPATDPPFDPKIWQAAQSFEAMAIGQLLAPMFNTVDAAHSLFGGGEAEAAWRPMLTDAIGKQMQAHGGLGLAQPVYDAMLRAQEGSAGQPARRITSHSSRQSA